VVATDTQRPKVAHGVVNRGVRRLPSVDAMVNVEFHPVAFNVIRFFQAALGTPATVAFADTLAFAFGPSRPVHRPTAALPMPRIRARLVIRQPLALTVL
jgi:hypothetical protein